MNAHVEWSEPDGAHRALWHSASSARPPRRIVLGDDTTTADTTYKRACEGTATLWRGDYHNARQLLAALGRRTRRKTPRDLTFHQLRGRAAQQARILGMLLVPVREGCVVPLRRAPDLRAACRAAGCPENEPFVVSLRELLGIVGAHQWRERGVPVAALDARIHPHYGVFAPTRQEHVDLVARAPLPGEAPATLEVGTGTGVLAAVLARRGARVVATDTNPRAVECARENLHRLGLRERVQVLEADLFAGAEPAQLVVANPPWLPAKPSSALEQGIYDPGARMLRGFLDGLPGRLAPGGEGWLLMSDLAERLGLREPGELPTMFEQAGLRVLDKLDTAPQHRRARDTSDPLHAARAAEVVTLWRLAAGAAPSTGG